MYAIRSYYGMHTGTPLYNLGGVSIIHGKIDFKVLEKSINIFIKKNDGLRLQMKEKNREVCQYVKEFEECTIDFFDFSKHKNAEAEFAKWSEEWASAPGSTDEPSIHPPSAPNRRA